MYSIFIQMNVHLLRAHVPYLLLMKYISDGFGDKQERNETTFQRHIPYPECSHHLRRPGGWSLFFFYLHFFCVCLEWIPASQSTTVSHRKLLIVSSNINFNDSFKDKSFCPHIENMKINLKITWHFIVFSLFKRKKGAKDTSSE